VPAHRMKAGREHRVPLSERAVAILKPLAEIKTGDFVFPGQRKNRSLSDRAMNATLHRVKADTDWAGNETSYPRDLIETALAHVVGDKAEQAYRRSDALEKRRGLMEAWANYCDPTRTAKVLPLRRPS